MEELLPLLKDFGLPIVILVLLFVGKYLRLGREVEREQQINADLVKDRDEWKTLAMQYVQQWSAEVLPTMKQMTEASERMLKRARRSVNDG